MGGFGFDAWRGGDAGEEGRVSAQAAGVMPDGITRQFPGGGRGPVAMSDFGGRRGPPRWSAQLGPGLRRSTGVGGFGFDAWPGGDAGGEGRVSTRAAGLLSDGNPTSVPRRGPGPSWHVGFWRTPRAATMVRPTGPRPSPGYWGGRVRLRRMARRQCCRGRARQRAGCWIGVGRELYVSTPAEAGAQSACRILADARGPPRWLARLGPGLRRGTGAGLCGFDA